MHMLSCLSHTHTFSLSFFSVAGAASFALGAAADAPLMVQLPQRAWGAAATLPASAGDPKRASLGVLREPFAAFNQTTTPMGQVWTSRMCGHSHALPCTSIHPMHWHEPYTLYCTPMQSHALCTPMHAIGSAHDSQCAPIHPHAILPVCP
eukprot:356735-Chlamydomonas_euryale.AAC.6